MKKKKTLPKPRALHVHVILVNKSKSGSSGKHAGLKSKQKVKRQMKALQRQGFFD